MSDIVERLEEQHRVGLFGVPDDFKFVSYAEAAAEITRLRSLVEEAKGVVGGIVELGDFAKRYTVLDDFDRGVRAARMDAAHAARSLLDKLKGE